jgi:hypothetical protein
MRSWRLWAVEKLQLEPHLNNQFYMQHCHKKKLKKLVQVNKAEMSMLEPPS